MSLPNGAKKVFEGVMFSLYQWEQEQFDGSFKTFEAVCREDSVQAIATTSDKKLILLKEEQPFHGSFISLPGGVCDSNLPSEDIKRELLEEIGVVPSDLILWKATKFSSKVHWKNHYFFAKNCKKIQEPRLDAGERIEPLFLSFDEFIDLVLSDDFRNKEFACLILRMLHDGSIEDFKELIFS